MTESLTKADLISDTELAALDRTPFGGACSYCHEILATEGDFARHFVVPDRQRPNLGWCPTNRRREP
jgi:hypothetical protein